VSPTVAGALSRRGFPSLGPLGAGPKPGSQRPLGRAGGLSQLNLNVHTSSQVELHQRVHGGGVRLHNVEQPLVGANFELLTRLLVDVRSAVDAELFNSRRQRNGAPDERRCDGRFPRFRRSPGRARGDRMP